MILQPILYFDMDGVLADFDSSPNIPLTDKHIYNHPEIFKEGFFKELPLMPGAIDFIQNLLKEDFWDIRILTKPVYNSPISYLEKAEWINLYFPELYKKITMTQDKLIVKGHVLIDDSKEWSLFKPNFFLFNPKNPIQSFKECKTYLDLLKLQYLFDTVK